MRLIVSMVACLLVAVAAQAQPPTALPATLSGRLSAGDQVVVTTVSGETLSGRVTQVSDTALVLRHGSDDRTFDAVDLQRIVRRRHGVRNGAILGVIVGGVVGGVVAVRADDCEITCFSSPAGVALFGGIGAAAGLGVGAGIGAIARPDQALFVRPDSALSWMGPSRAAGFALRFQVTW